MVIVRLIGGLGNQLFQYAAARRLALAREAPLVLDLGWFRHEAAHYATPRRYELDRFRLSTRTVSLTPETIAHWEQGLPARLRRWPSRRVCPPILRQREDAIDERTLAAPVDAVLIGYWQSERYFEDVADTIRSELVPPAAPDPRFERLRATVAEPGAVAVHVRRGDYVTVPRTNEVHGTLPPSYYRRAVDLVVERLQDPVHLFLFSDDPEWAAEHLRFELPITHVSRFSWAAVEELALMASCRHHVIANSSFSWWGAWLADRPGHIVVGPRSWFRDESLDSSGVLPERWLKA